MDTASLGSFRSSKPQVQHMTSVPAAPYKPEVCAGRTAIISYLSLRFHGAVMMCILVEVMTISLLSASIENVIFK